MAQKDYSSSMFWARHVALALVLVVVAGLMIYFQQNKQNQPLPEGEDQDKSIEKGLSAFYREFRMSSNNPIDEEGESFVIEVEASDTQLDNTLERMSSIVEPIEAQWTGEQKYRTFQEGMTLREAISSYAEAEGMKLIWNLNQDFIIKHQFQIDNTVAGSLTKIASAIDPNFEGKVKVYMCSDQRSLVITETETEFLKDNCSQLNP